MPDVGKMKKKIPFDFVLDELAALQPRVRAMFGCYAIYIGEKIVLLLRNRDDDHPEINGIWIATSHEHHASLKKDFPSMKSIRIFAHKNSESSWQMISVDEDDFESSAMKLCGMILRRDEKIGTIPKKKNQRLNDSKFKD